MSANKIELTHLIEVTDALQRRHSFTVGELEDNRGHESRVAAVALERAQNMAPAGLGRILCVMQEALLWANYARVWPAEAATATGDEEATLRLKVALILIYSVGARLGVCAGDGWGYARTSYRRVA